MLMSSSLYVHAPDVLEKLGSKSLFVHTKPLKHITGLYAQAVS